jgi:acyl-homoserine-lactone acylase
MIRNDILSCSLAVFLVLSLALSLLGCGGAPDPASLIPAEGKYEVKILRDEFGVPHLYGRRDADVAYGLAYAHCEDDFDTIQKTLILARGKLAAVEGQEAAPFDYLVKLFRFQELVAENYDTQLAPETRAICDAYADGFNHYAALNPDQVLMPSLLPATGQDVVTGFVLKTPMFFGMEREVERLFRPERQREVSPKHTARAGGFLTKGLPIGSNTFSVAPSRTPDGKTHLAVNSHQPWTGPVAWYEARMKSEEGMDIIGGVFPGTPIILHGHNRDLGWAHTVNMPDLVDIYVLEMNPENPDQYRFEGEWRDLETGRVGITVRLWGNLKWTVRREVLYSVHGPVVRQPHGVYAIRYAGYGDIRQVEQWYRMGKAQNIDEFEEALRIRAIPSFNVGYADKEGNIWYLYNALLPMRPEGYDWRQYLPGDTSETLWNDYLPFEKLPQVRNPASGFVQNCNSTPYRTTTGPGNPRPEDYSPAFGIEEEMTNRALRALELFGNDDAITEEAFYAYKYDWKYSTESHAAKLRDKILTELETEDPIVIEALDILRNWDLSADPDNTGTAVAILAMEPVVRAELFGRPAPDLVELFQEKARALQETFGRMDVPWKEVNRLVRGEVNLGMGGGPDVLHAVYGDWKGTHLEGVAGDCYVLMVSWDPDGAVQSRSIHQFGSATLDEASPHYADQAPLFAARETKPVRLDEEDLRQHLSAEYRPGEARPAP